MVGVLAPRPGCERQRGHGADRRAGQSVDPLATGTIGDVQRRGIVDAARLVVPRSPNVVPDTDVFGRGDHREAALREVGVAVAKRIDIQSEQSSAGVAGIQRERQVRCTVREKTCGVTVGRLRATPVGPRAPVAADGVGFRRAQRLML